MGWPGKPAEVAPVFVYLSCSYAPAATAQVLHVSVNG